MRLHLLTAAAAVALLPATAMAAGSSPLTIGTLTSTSYTQNFDTLASSGTTNSLPAGFQIVEAGAGSAADGRYVAGTGSSNAGGAYSFGAAGSTDRALGSLGSGTAAPIYLGGVFSNGLSGAISAITLAFTGEQWRAGSSAVDGLFFEYSLDATALNNGSWTALSALDFLPLVITGNAALDGNAAANSRAISATIDGLDIAAGQTFAFRWTDLDSTGNDQGLAIDNLSLNLTQATAPTTAVPEPASWAMLTLGFGALGFAMRRAKRSAVAFA